MYGNPRQLAQVLGVAAALSFSSGAAAAIVTITFDETGIDVGDTITTQYSGIGATFSGTAAAQIKLGSGFNNAFPSDGQIAHLQTNGGDIAYVDLDAGADYLGFDFRRPLEAGEIDLRILDGATEVHDFGAIGWDPSVTPDWVTFEYLGDFGSYDRVELSGDGKFVIDNLAFGVQAVPLPAPLVLLGSALGLLAVGRRLGRVPV